MNISILGAGNGGQAMAAHFSLLGHKVKLYNRSFEKIELIKSLGGINLTGVLTGFAKLDLITDDIQLAIEGAEIIMVTTTASGHKNIAEMIAPFVKENQIVVLSPGRTLGAIEFEHVLSEKTNTKVIIGEAQSLIYACRIESPGLVRIIGIKENILFSAYPSTNTDLIIDKINSIYKCFVKVKNVLHTSLENIGAILHPSIVLFNAAAIERGNLFYFYNDMTPAVANFLSEIDKERIMIGKGFDIDLLSVSDWVSFAYKDIKGVGLLEKMKNNPAYNKIMAPSSLDSRLLTEDIPTGILPFIELGKLVNVKTPLFNSVLYFAETLLQTDFQKKGRSFKNIGLEGVTKNELLNLL